MRIAEGKQELRGLRVSITGRLASMSRDEACARIAAAGGQYDATPGADTALLVVGQGGPPLGEDGRLTRSLRAARDLRDAGASVEIVAEHDFLAALGLDERREGMHRLYTTAQLSRILGVPMAAVRSWIRHGLVQPARVVNRLCFFDFAQVASAKALSQLTDSGVTPARLRKSLEQIAAWLPDSGSALAQLEMLEQGGPLVLRTDEGALVETTGQMRLDFQSTAVGEPAPTPAIGAVPEASDWFERGVHAEESGDLDEAVRAYERAVASDEARADAWFNLGNTLYATGRLEHAQEAYRTAVRLEPAYVEAWNNLANVLCEAGQVSEGIEAYERAIAVAPGYADAHYNLAEALAAEGDLERARRHWRAYLEQDPHSSSAREIRERLDRLRD